MSSGSFACSTSGCKFCVRARARALSTMASVRILVLVGVCIVGTAAFSLPSSPPDVEGRRMAGGIISSSMLAEQGDTIDCMSCDAGEDKWCDEYGYTDEGELEDEPKLSCDKHPTESCDYDTCRGNYNPRPPPAAPWHGAEGTWPSPPPPPPNNDWVIPMIVSISVVVALICCCYCFACSGLWRDFEKNGRPNLSDSNKNYRYRYDGAFDDNCGCLWRPCFFLPWAGASCLYWIWHRNEYQAAKSDEGSALATSELDSGKVESTVRSAASYELEKLTEVNKTDDEGIVPPLFL